MFKVENNWEQYKYTYDGIDITNKDIDFIIDGITYKPKWVKVTVSYTDMGHRYTTERFEMMVDATIGNVTVPVCIDSYNAHSFENAIVKINKD